MTNGALCDLTDEFRLTMYIQTKLELNARLQISILCSLGDRQNLPIYNKPNDVATDMTTIRREFTRLAKTVCALCLVLASAYTMAHDCECANHTEEPLQAPANSVEEASESIAVVEQTETDTEVAAAETPANTEEADSTDAVPQASEPEEVVAEEDNALPIYTVQVLAYRNKRKAEIRSRVVPKLYGKAKVVVERSKRETQPKVYTVIAGEFEGYTPAKEAAQRLCEPVYLNGCFVRRMADVDANRYVEPEKPAETAESDKKS